MGRKITKISTVLILSFLIIIMNFIPVVAEVKTDNINYSKIDEFINSKMKSAKIPGISLSIVKDDKIIYLKGYGVDGKNRPITLQTPFFLGSVSKSFTGLAIIQLVEKGKIDLNAPVQKYLPWFCLADKEASKQITIKQLLSQTSGLSTYVGSKMVFKDNVTLEQFVRNQKNTKLSNLPGELFQYSNLNYVILGEIIQAVSGISYEQYIQENIFNPLDMKHSYINENEAFKNGLSNGYKSYFGFMLPTKQLSHGASVSAGYLISSSEDMAHYLIAQMNNGFYKNSSILSKDGMYQTHIPNSVLSNYGIGWFIYNGLVTHGGDTENFHTDVRMYNIENIGIAMLFNSNDYITTTISNGAIYSDIQNGVADIVHGIEPVMNTKSNVLLIRSIINLVGIVIAVLLLMAIFRVFKWKSRLKSNKVSLTINVIGLIVLNILIPLAITVFAPNVLASRFDASIEVFILTIPDFGILGISIPIVLFAIGIAKTIILVSFIRNKESNKTSNM